MKVFAHPLVMVPVAWSGIPVEAEMFRCDGAFDGEGGASRRGVGQVPASGVDGSVGGEHSDVGEGQVVAGC